MSASKLFGKDILITSTTNASGSTVGSISTLGGINVNQTMLVLGALTSTADSNTIGNLFTTGGNVGFGTTSPVQRLDVNGNLNITGNFYQNGSVYSGSTQWGSTGANIYFNTGNVGIGTLSPTAKLQVDGEVNLNIMSGFNTSGLVTLGRADGVGRNSAIKVYNSTGGNSYMSFEVHNGTAGSRNTPLLMDGFGNVGIGTTTPVNRLHVVGLTTNTGGVIAEFRNSSNGERIQIIDETTTGLPPGICSPTAGYGIGIYGRAGNIRFLTTSSNLERMTIISTGNVGIGTTSPAFTLDVNGTIARAGVKLPRFDNGSFSGSASFSIPILFNDTQYNYAEIRVRYVTSAVCNINISATSYTNAAMGFNECALTTVKWNAQGTPVYSTFTSVNSGLFADTVEQVGLDNNFIFRINRSSGTSTTGLRNHYTYDNVYCLSGVGTARGYGQGHIDNASVGGSPLQFVTFTCSTGTVSGTYSTVHYY